MTGAKKARPKTYHPWNIKEVWVEHIVKEKSRQKQWEQMYGWMADFDSKV